MSLHIILMILNVHQGYTICGDVLQNHILIFKGTRQNMLLLLKGIFVLPPPTLNLRILAPEWNFFIALQWHVANLQCQTLLVLGSILLLKDVSNIIFEFYDIPWSLRPLFCERMPSKYLKNWWKYFCNCILLAGRFNYFQGLFMINFDKSGLSD